MRHFVPAILIKIFVCFASEPKMSAGIMASLHAKLSETQITLAHQILI